MRDGFAVRDILSTHVVEHIINIPDAVLGAPVYPWVEGCGADCSIRVQRGDLSQDAEHFLNEFRRGTIDSVLQI